MAAPPLSDLLCKLLSSVAVKLDRKGDGEAGDVTGRQLEHLVAGRWERAGLEPPTLYPWDRVHLARRALERTSFQFGEDPRIFAAGLGLRLFPMHGRACGKEWAGDDFVAYTWTRDRRERGLRIFHGISHCLLRLEGWHDSTHADAWLLTLEMAAPHAICRQLDPTDVARDAHAPEAVIEAWASLSRKLGAMRSVA